MLNFGYWDGVDSPLLAQQSLCSMLGRLGRLANNQTVLDVGSGYGSPALQWKSEHNPIDIISLNINHNQLADSEAKNSGINCTATTLPFKDSVLDRILVLESAQHFKPISNFLSESFRSLKDNGYLAIAIPVMTRQATDHLTGLGLLSFTWSSEHYSEDYILSSIRESGFEIDVVDRIGSLVYVPLADYYERNRREIQKKILQSYPAYIERILYNSIRKMRRVSEKGIIDYLMISCQKPS